MSYIKKISMQNGMQQKHKCFLVSLGTFNFNVG